MNEHSNLPTSFDVSPLLSKLERVEDDCKGNLLQRVKLIELDPHYSSGTSDEQSSNAKTRLFLAVAFGKRTAVAQLITSELGRAHGSDGAAEGGQNEGEEQLEWIDAPRANGGGGPVVVFPPSRAESLPVALGEQKDTGAPNNGSKIEEDAAFADITSCALIPAPAIRSTGKLLTQRTVSVMLGTAHDQVLSVALKVADVPSADDVQFELEYDECKLVTEGELQESGKANSPCAHQILPSPKRYGAAATNAIEEDSGNFGRRKYPTAANAEGQGIAMNKDIIWITYGNGSFARLPSWKPFLTFSSDDGGIVSDEVAGPGDGSAVTPFCSLFRSPLDVPPSQAHRNSPSLENEAEISASVNTDEYWTLLTSASAPASTTPIAFNSAKVKCDPSDEANGETGISLGPGSAMQEEQSLGNGGMNESPSGVSSDDDAYGPVTGTVVEGTAALVKGALGVAFGAARWGLGYGAGANEGQDHDDTPFDEFMEATANHSDAIASLAFSDIPRRFDTATVDPSATMAATTDNLGRVILFDLETKQPIRMLKGNAKRIAKQTESEEGSGMARKAAISELESKLAYHDRLSRAFSVLHGYEDKADLKAIWQTRFLPSSRDVHVKGDDEPLPFSKFATACQFIGDADRVEFTKVKKARVSILKRVFRPLRQDLFVYKIVNSLISHLGIEEDFDLQQQYFGEWSSTLPTEYMASSNLYGTWRPMSRKMEDLPKAFVLAAICLDAVSAAAMTLEQKTYGKVTELDSVRPWKELLRKLRVCLLVTLRLNGDVSPIGGANPMTVSNVSRPAEFSVFSWLAKDELSESHDNQVIVALESACLSSSEAFYPSTEAGDDEQKQQAIFQSCNQRGLSLLFYLNAYARFPAHLAANRALILTTMWGQMPERMNLLEQSITALQIVVERAEEFSLATLVEIYQSRFRPVCRAILFGFGDHELSEEVFLPLIDNPQWTNVFVSLSKQMLSMIMECMAKSHSEESPINDATSSEMWPPLRECPILTSLAKRLPGVQQSSVELHHTVVFAYEMTHDVASLERMVPSFHSLFLDGDQIFAEMPAIQASSQQKSLLDKAIVDHAQKTTSPVVDNFAMVKSVEQFGSALGVDAKYVRTHYLVEMIRLGKDTSINDLLGASSSSLDKTSFAEEVVHIICSRLNATILSLKQTKNYRGILGLLDAETSQWVKEVAAKCTIMGQSAAAPARRHGAAALVVLLVAGASCAVSVGLLLLGLLREGPQFYHGRECRMTYSRFQFLPLRVLPPPARAPSAAPSAPGRYRLLKFTDQRDPRHKHLYPISGDLVENYETQSNAKRPRANGKVVGYGRQLARSIGAHGARWTGQHKDQAMSDREIYESLYTGKRMNGGLDEFVMDAEFFARAVETIAEGCRLDDETRLSGKQTGITIVAHSIGAWVVRIALRMHPHLAERGWVRNVVTLASPLGSVPYAVDGGVHDIARHINDVGQNEGDVTLISISGGLLDEMMPPEVCRIPAATKGQDANGAGVASDAFLASSIVQRHSSQKVDQLGMDHRAIVWCYDLLKVVREVIFSLVVAIIHEQNASERLEIAQKTLREGNTTIYQEEVLRQHSSLVQDVGYLKAVSIQLSAPYHLNSLLKLCIAAAMMHLIFDDSQTTNEWSKFPDE
ncbi:hypothetical protein ACHAXT_007789 [Thalassiosira profunda]